MKKLAQIREAKTSSNIPSQGSSMPSISYDELDMNNLIKDVISKIPEDDGPHTSKPGDAPNFTTVANPADVINQDKSEGNRENLTQTSKRLSGKPFKKLRKQGLDLHPEDLTGAVSQVAIGEEVIDEAKDKGEYDYEGDMAMTQLRSILYNAKMLHDMLEPNTNLPEWVQSKITLAEDYIVTVAQYMHAEMNEEVQQDISELSDMRKKIYIRKATADKEAHLQRAKQHETGAEVFSFADTTNFKQNAARERYKALKRQQGINKAQKSLQNSFDPEIQEGSARSHITRKGLNTDRPTHLKAASDSEKLRGVVQDPKTDGRSYSWTHQTNYKTGEPYQEPPQKKELKGKALRDIRKNKQYPQHLVKPVTPDHPLAHILSVIKKAGQ